MGRQWSVQLNCWPSDEAAKQLQRNFSLARAKLEVMFQS